jgi:DNA-binding response OmpR family regulator
MQGACQANAITLNDEVLSVACQGHSIRLLPKEFRLFQFLFAHPNRTFSRDALLDAVWPMETPVDRTVDDHIYRLRKKLSAACFPVTLETVRGRGYRFVPGLATGKIPNLPALETQQGLQSR